SRDTTVAEIMSTTVLHVAPEQTVNDCMALMTDKKIGHLPVLVNNKIIGILPDRRSGKSVYRQAGIRH
ncbi:MAG: CBS domain-containing protein, partial [Gammaproteobacteria bacterium]